MDGKELTYQKQAFHKATVFTRKHSDAFGAAIAAFTKETFVLFSTQKIPMVANHFYFSNRNYNYNFAKK